MLSRNGIKKVGDRVNSGDVIAEVETDKATMDFDSYQDGVLLYIGPKEGEAVPINAIIAVLGEEGEDFQALLKEDTTKDKPAEATESVIEADDTDEGEEVTPES